MSTESGIETVPNPTRGGTQLDTLPRPSHGDTSDDLFHYVDKAKIVESAVTGTVVTALCGAVFPVTKTPKPGSAVCPQCTELLEMLKSFDSGGEGGSGGDSA